MKRNTPKYLYAIECWGLIKIGISQDPHRRMKALSAVRFAKVLLTSKLVLEAKRDERIIHWFFRGGNAGRLSCEWFDIPAESAKWAIDNIHTLRKIEVLIPPSFSMAKYWRSLR